LGNVSFIEAIAGGFERLAPTFRSAPLLGFDEFFQSAG